MAPSGSSIKLRFFECGETSHLKSKDTPTYSVEFDHSGNYLAMSGSDVRVYNVANVKSEWNEIKALPDLSGTGKTTCVKFGLVAKYLAVGSMDRNRRVFGLPGDENTNEDKTNDDDSSESRIGTHKAIYLFTE